MRYFAIQDPTVGFIQFLTRADDERDAVRRFDDDIGLGEESRNPDDWEITELTSQQYEQLDPFDGDDQEAVDLLESWKRDGVTPR